MLRQTTLVLLGLAVVLATAAAASATMYRLTNLGTLGTGTYSSAVAVNDSGVVAGGAWTTTAGSSTTATIYQNGAWVNIGAVIGITKTYANGITDSGLVSVDKGLDGDSYIYNMNTSQATNIENQSGVCNGAANHCGSDTTNDGQATLTGSPINSSGQMVGYYNASGGGYDLFAYSGGTNGSTSTITTPQTGSGTNFTGASGINNSGVVVGNYQVGGNPIPTGFYYESNTCTTINNMTYPEGIYGNEVVGANYEPGHTEAMVYTLGAGSATSIGDLPGDTDGIAYAADANGDVVGADTDSNLAFIYSNGVMSNLNTLISGLDPFSSLNVAYGISPNGEYIVGNGTTSAGYTQGFLLTAIATPEPSTLLLAAGGLVGLLAYAWRKRK
jgi:probable HAF family extracellular repeat protein